MGDGEWDVVSVEMGLLRGLVGDFVRMGWNRAGEATLDLGSVRVIDGTRDRLE